MIELTPVQEQFVDEVFRQDENVILRGAQAGGKTTALAYAALTAAARGEHVAILVGEHARLPGGMLDRIHEIAQGKPFRLVAHDLKVIHTETGGTVSILTPKVAQRIQGAEFNRLFVDGIDEVGENTLMRFMARLRQNPRQIVATHSPPMWESLFTDDHTVEATIADNPFIDVDIYREMHGRAFPGWPVP